MDNNQLVVEAYARNKSIVISDYDDGDLVKLYATVQNTIDVTHFALGLPSSEYDVDFYDSDFSLRSIDVRLDTLSFATAPVVVYRRSRMDARRKVQSLLKGSDDRRFEEREWDSTLDAILRIAARKCPTTIWVNDPSADLLVQNKILLLHSAHHIGFTVPEFRISTYTLLPHTHGTLINQYVGKAISVDEHIGRNLYYSTTDLPAELLADIKGKRTSTPSLVQRRILSSHEIRIFYFIGHIIGIRASAREPYTDIRLASSMAAEFSSDRVPPELEIMIRRLCGEWNLNYCTFDVLVRDSEYWLVDVTPNGTWSYLDRGLGVMNFFAERLCSEHMAATRE